MNVDLIYYPVRLLLRIREVALESPKLEENTEKNKRKLRIQNMFQFILVVVRSPHQQTWQRGRVFLTSALRLRSRLLSRLTGTRAWPRSDTRRCHWKPNTTQMRELGLWRGGGWKIKGHYLNGSGPLTCPECRKHSTGRRGRLYARLKCHWTSCGAFSSWRRSGRCWLPPCSSVLHAAEWNTISPHMSGRLRKKTKIRTIA